MSIIAAILFVVGMIGLGELLMMMIDDWGD